jgi:hypothetical protein
LPINNCEKARGANKMVSNLKVADYRYGSKYRGLGGPTLRNKTGEPLQSGGKPLVVRTADLLMAHGVVAAQYLHVDPGNNFKYDDRVQKKSAQIARFIAWARKGDQYAQAWLRYYEERKDIITDLAQLGTVLHVGRSRNFKLHYIFLAMGPELKMLFNESSPGNWHEGQILKTFFSKRGMVRALTTESSVGIYNSEIIGTVIKMLTSIMPEQIIIDGRACRYGFDLLRSSEIAENQPLKQSLRQHRIGAVFTLSNTDDEIVVRGNKSNKSAGFVLVLVSGPKAPKILLPLNR